MLEPRELNVSETDGSITIVWSDGHRGIYNSFHLREACPCAMCKGEPGVFGKYYSAPKVEIRQDIQPQEINSVGRYGLKILWSDGHDLGIYTFDYLRDHCECEECRSKKSACHSTPR